MGHRLPSQQDLPALREQEQVEMGDKTEYIKLKVISQDSNEIHFRVKRTTQIGYRTSLNVPPSEGNGTNEDVAHLLGCGERLH